MRCRIVGTPSAALVRCNRESPGFGSSALLLSDRLGGPRAFACPRVGCCPKSRTSLSFAREVNQKHHEEGDGNPRGRLETPGREDTREQTNHDEGHGEPNLGGCCEHLESLPDRRGNDNVRRRGEQNDRQIGRGNRDETDKQQSKGSPRCPFGENRRHDNQGTFCKTVEELPGDKGGSKGESHRIGPRKALPQHKTIRDRVQGEVGHTKREQARRTSAPSSPQEIGDTEPRKDPCGGRCGGKGRRCQKPGKDGGNNDNHSCVGDSPKKEHAHPSRPSPCLSRSQ